MDLTDGGKKLKKIEDNVKTILETYPETRQSDHALYVKYLETILHLPLNSSTFVNSGLPFETVSRLRRKVQREYPELKNPYFVCVRGQMQMELRSYCIGY